MAEISEHEAILRSLAQRLTERPSRDTDGCGVVDLGAYAVSLPKLDGREIVRMFIVDQRGWLGAVVNRKHKPRETWIFCDALANPDSLPRLAAKLAEYGITLDLSDLGNHSP